MLRDISLTGSSIGFTNSNGSDVPRVPDSVVGFQVLLQELKLKMLEEKDQVMVLSAPAGYGKTTLAAMVCQKDDMKESEPKLEEDEALAKESLNVELSPPPRSLFPSVSYSFRCGYRVCAGCNAEIVHGRYLSCMGAVWHPECFLCYCDQQIFGNEFSMSDNRPYHKSCYKQQHHPKFDVCKLLTGSILAHEMIHAWLRLKGYPSLSPEVEEGVCQVLAHMWLDSEIIAGSGSNSTSASSSSSSSPSTSSKTGKRSEFEKKLREFFKHQIESDTSAAYGDGFGEGNKAVLKYGLKKTLDHIRLTGTFPC